MLCSTTVCTEQLFFQPFYDIHNCLMVQFVIIRL